MGIRRNGRIVAIQGLYAWEETKCELESVLQFDWLDSDVGDDVRSFAALIISGVVENQSDIDEHIRKQLKNWSFDRLTKVDLSILRTGVYSILCQKEIPISVTINEAVEIAKQLGSPESYRFINGVLDGIQNSIIS